MDDSTLLIICIGGAVALVGYFLAMLVNGDKSGKLRSRLVEQREAGAPPTTDKPVMPVLQSVGQAASGLLMPKKRETQSEMRRRLAYAGVYAPNAVSVIQFAGSSIDARTRQSSARSKSPLSR